MKKILFSLIFVVFLLAGCSIAKTQQVSNSENNSLPSQPKQVVENYYKYSNDKNKKALLTTLTEWHNAPNVDLGLDNLDFIKTISISEDTNQSQKEAYIKYGRGTLTGATEKNVAIVKVTYLVKYKKENSGPQNSGIYTTWFTLIRKDKNSQWLIDDIGEG